MKSVDLTPKIRWIAIIVAFAIAVFATRTYLASKVESPATPLLVKPIPIIEEKLKIKEAVSEMVRRFQAISDWKRGFDKKNTIYTIHLQKALLETNGRPLLFYASLEDVFNRDEQHVARFVDWLDLGFLDRRRRILLELQCNAAQTNKLLESQGEVYTDNFAIIAFIDDVRRPKFAVEPYAHGFEETAVEIEAADVFIATGVCLDLMHVGDYIPE